MRTVGDIRSESVTILEHSSGSWAELSAVPFTLISVLAFAHGTEANPRPWFTAVLLLGLSLALVLAGRRRERRVPLPRGSLLAWEAGQSADDAYRVVMNGRGHRIVLLEHEDPAVVLGDVRRLTAELECSLVGAEGLAAATGHAPVRARHAFRVVAPVWLGQQRVVQALLGGSVFVAVVFLAALRAHQSDASWASRLMPCSGLLFMLLVAFWLLSLRTHLVFGPKGLRVEKRAFGRSWGVWELPASQITNVRAIGHTGHPVGHLLFETEAGCLSVRMASGSAHRVTSAFEATEPSPKASSSATRSPDPRAVTESSRPPAVTPSSAP